jgi:hypothetical protein
MTQFQLHTTSKAPWSLRGLVGSGVLDQGVADLLSDALERSTTLMVCGPKDSGRTTVLSALAHEARRPFLWSGDKDPLDVPGTHREVSSDVPGVPHVVDGGPVTDLERTLLLTGSKRGAAGSLNALAASLGTGDALERVARRIGLVVVCSRRQVEVGGRLVLRRVVESVQALEGTRDGLFLLEDLARVDASSGDASWEVVETFSGARERVEQAGWGEVEALVRSLRALVNHPFRRRTSLTQLLEALVTYGGVEGAFAADLLLLHASRGPSDAGDALLALSNVEALSTSARIELEAASLLEWEALDEAGRPEPYASTCHQLDAVAAVLEQERRSSLRSHAELGEYTNAPRRAEDLAAMERWARQDS